MKKLLSITLILSALVFLSACGDDIPESMPDSVSGSTSQSFTLLSAANTTQNVEVTFNLRDFAALSEYYKYVKSGSALPTSSIEMSGIETDQEVKLTNVSLSLKRDNKKSVSLPNIESNGKIAANTPAAELSFMQALLDEIVSRGSSTVVLKYKPETAMGNSNNKLTIQLNANFRLR